MKALTIWQPWASLIIAGAKPYEFRGWRAPTSIIGQRVVIHAAATGMAETVGQTILLAEQGETFTLSSREIWVKPGALALAVDNNQHAFRIDAGAA